MTEPSGSWTMVAAENSGCDGGCETGAHDADVTLH
jgi:hypothetical protein